MGKIIENELLSSGFLGVTKNVQTNSYQSKEATRISDITFDVLNEGTIKPDMVGMWRTRLQGSVVFTSRKLGRECWMESRLFMLFSNGKRPLRCLWQATKSTKSNAVNHAEDIRRQKKHPPYNWLRFLRCGAWRSTALALAQDWIMECWRWSQSRGRISRPSTRRAEAQKAPLNEVD